MLVLHTTERVRKCWKLKPHGPDIHPALLPLRHWQIHRGLSSRKDLFVTTVDNGWLWTLEKGRIRFV